MLRPRRHLSHLVQGNIIAVLPGMEEVPVTALLLSSQLAKLKSP